MTECRDCGMFLDEENEFCAFCDSGPIGGVSGALDGRVRSSFLENLRMLKVARLRRRYDGQGGLFVALPGVHITAAFDPTLEFVPPTEMEPVRAVIEWLSDCFEPGEQVEILPVDYYHEESRTLPERTPELRIFFCFAVHLQGSVNAERLAARLLEKAWLAESTLARDASS